MMMFSHSEKRGIKRKAGSEWSMSEDDVRGPNGQYWKRYLYDLDGFVYADFVDGFVYEDPENPKTHDFNKWMMQFANVPKCFIVKYHDLVHPMILDYMFDINYLTIEEYKSCAYPMGYPSSFYFG